MFKTSWVHPQGDSYICSVVCFTCIGVSSLVDRRKRLSGNMTRLGEKINAYRVSVRNVEGKRPLGRPCHM
jgi:hypothetical protein